MCRNRGFVVEWYYRKKEEIVTNLIIKNYGTRTGKQDAPPLYNLCHVQLKKELKFLKQE